MAWNGTEGAQTYARGTGGFAPNAIDDETGALEALAAACRGDYDGWETEVVRAGI